MAKTSRARFDSAIDASDFANVRADRKLIKTIDGEEILFSDEVTKTNHQGKRQRRVLVLTGEALYNFKKNNYQKAQRRMPLEHVETIFRSAEYGADLMLKIRETDNMMLEMSKRYLFVKTLQSACRSKTGKEVDQMQVSSLLLNKAKFLIFG